MRCRTVLLIVFVTISLMTSAWTQNTGRFRNMPPLNDVVTVDTFAVDAEVLDTPNAASVFLDGSGAGTKDVDGLNFTQDMTYTLAVSFKFEASNPTRMGELIQYDLANSGGTIHFYGQAIDVFMGQTTILNFDHTYNYLTGTGSGVLTYSPARERVETIDFVLPLGAPGKFRPSRLRFSADSGLLRVDILNFSFWMFDEDYRVPAASNRCAPSLSCPKPKALLVAGHGDVPLVAKTLAAAAEDLWDRGWVPLIPPNPTLEDIIQQLNNDPCIRGLYVTSHGTPNGSIVLSRQGNPDKPWRVRPADLAAKIPGSQLDFVTIFSCYVLKPEWQLAFPQSRIVIPDKMIKGLYADSDRVLKMQRLQARGTPLKACDQFGLTVFSKLGEKVLPSAGVCPSFAICDSTACGADLFPVTSCADSVGILTGSEFSIAPRDSMFVVTVHLPSAYIDSVGCGASYFTNVPADLVHPELIPLGRFLLLADVEEDSLVGSDSITVIMKYLDSDLVQAGIGDETKLAPYWTSADSVELQLVRADLDTVGNCVTFSVPRWGLVGIYADDVTGLQENNLMHNIVRLYQNYPNPFNPMTRIVFDIGKTASVELSIYDVLGRKVATLVNRDLGAGKHEVVWNGRTGEGRVASSGIYFCRLTAGNLVETKKIILLR